MRLAGITRMLYKDEEALTRLEPIEHLRKHVIEMKKVLTANGAEPKVLKINLSTATQYGLSHLEIFEDLRVLIVENAEEGIAYVQGSEQSD